MPLILDIGELRKLQKRRRQAKRTAALRPPAKAEILLRREAVRLWKQAIKPSLERIKEAIRREIDAEDLALLLDEELRTLEAQYGMSAGAIVNRWRVAVDELTREHISQALGKTLGIDITAVLDEEPVDTALTVASWEASNLIKTIPQELLGQVARAVTDNLRGVPLQAGRTLLQQIEHLGGVSKKRAQLIARDQTAKLTGELNRVRQQSIGVETYIWRTSKDERVVGNPAGKYPEGNDKHGNHYVMEGVTCKWADPTVYSLDGGKTWKKRTGEMPKTHVGIDIQCRCYGEPVVDIERIVQMAKVA